jgi:hypothetical protein
MKPKYMKLHRITGPEIHVIPIFQIIPTNIFKFSNCVVQNFILLDSIALTKKINPRDLLEISVRPLRTLWAANSKLFEMSSHAELGFLAEFATTTH